MSHNWRVCTRCGEGYPLTEKNFQRSSTNKSGFAAACTHCSGDGGRGQVQTRNRGERRPRRQKICGGCYGLTDRRPPEGCPVCGKAHAERKPFGVDDALEMAHHAPRVLV